LTHVSVSYDEAVSSRLPAQSAEETHVQRAQLGVRILVTNAPLERAHGLFRIHGFRADDIGYFEVEGDILPAATVSAQMKREREQMSDRFKHIQTTLCGSLHLLLNLRGRCKPARHHSLAAPVCCQAEHNVRRRAGEIRSGQVRSGPGGDDD
jgi:hypothetical protein